ncbi:uncharacterized protein MONOS_3343 [Monocercomonoides exilis]|uniref:uncharacterized protein n=1 Tax=Monocercomonoides exilis TaxID=2049356 RepID=UPI003559F1A6|nr:hypothetical protein MONOS_3343 [Monocercomonoides exilis]|eukprot:MONOS_3343.1-p1 / transcript=MONOS_3343.1 / gene=MONOS_3343 / organism=Monocercomonoides_exilis_PA203 / gene_product=unspecified product / transcript_product=unspecified product / location=Mono_scaffold00078:16829-20149(+) / protein_length=1028 / sequence_SO=supercontig / SO=protein_coding / is_pseudo=false
MKIYILTFTFLVAFWLYQPAGAAAPRPSVEELQQYLAQQKQIMTHVKRATPFQEHSGLQRKGKQQKLADDQSSSSSSSSTSSSVSHSKSDFEAQLVEVIQKTMTEFTQKLLTTTQNTLFAQAKEGAERCNTKPKEAAAKQPTATQQKSGADRSPRAAGTPRPAASNVFSRLSSSSSPSPSSPSPDSSATRKRSSSSSSPTTAMLAKKFECLKSTLDQSKARQLGPNASKLVRSSPPQKKAGDGSSVPSVASPLQRSSQSPGARRVQRRVNIVRPDASVAKQTGCAAPKEAAAREGTCALAGEEPHTPVRVQGKGQAPALPSLPVLPAMTPTQSLRVAREFIVSGVAKEKEGELDVALPLYAYALALLRDSDELKEKVRKLKERTEKKRQLELEKRRKEEEEEEEKEKDKDKEKDEGKMEEDVESGKTKESRGSSKRRKSAEKTEEGKEEEKAKRKSSNTKKDRNSKKSETSSVPQRGSNKNVDGKEEKEKEREEKKEKAKQERGERKKSEKAIRMRMKKTEEEGSSNVFDYDMSDFEEEEEEEASADETDGASEFQLESDEEGGETDEEELEAIEHHRKIRRRGTAAKRGSTKQRSSSRSSSRQQKGKEETSDPSAEAVSQIVASLLPSVMLSSAHSPDIPHFCTDAALPNQTPNALQTASEQSSANQSAVFDPTISPTSLRLPALSAVSTPSADSFHLPQLPLAGTTSPSISLCSDTQSPSPSQLHPFLPSSLSPSLSPSPSPLSSSSTTTSSATSLRSINLHSLRHSSARRSALAFSSPLSTGYAAVATPLLPDAKVGLPLAPLQTQTQTQTPTSTADTLQTPSFSVTDTSTSSSSSSTSMPFVHTSHHPSLSAFKSRSLHSAFTAGAESDEERENRAEDSAAQNSSTGAAAKGKETLKIRFDDSDDEKEEEEEEESGESGEGGESGGAGAGERRRKRRRSGMGWVLERSSGGAGEECPQKEAEERILRILNFGQKEEIKHLKGVGDKRATAILSHREGTLFNDVLELRDVGFSEKMIQAVLSSG